MIIKASLKDQARVLAFASELPSENLFIIGDIESYGIDNKTVSVWMEEIDGKMEGIYLKYLRNFIIYSKNQKFNPAEVVDLCLKNHAKVINGLKKTTDLLYPHLKETFNAHNCFYCILKDPDQLQINTALTTDPSKEDADEIATLLSEIEEFEMNYKDSLRSVSEKINNPQHTNKIIKLDGTIVSYGATLVESSSAGMIGSIFCVKEQREKGYASMLVSSICKALLNKHKGACLFYNNPKAGSIYHRLGFETIDEWVMLKAK